ncbi:Uncharacterised protein, partial [Metamycoplasma alkalescens]
MDKNNKPVQPKEKKKIGMVGIIGIFIGIVALIVLILIAIEQIRAASIKFQDISFLQKVVKETVADNELYVSQW